VTATLTLRPGREKSLRRHHPWIFSGAVADVAGNAGPGDTVIVRSNDGTRLGRAAYSPASQIRARMWTFDADVEISGDLITERIHASAAARRTWLADDMPQRIVFSESDGVPGLVADRYGDVVVCQLGTAGAERWRDVISDALFALPGVRSVYERSDTDGRARDGLASRVGAMRGEEPGELVIDEDGWRFVVDVAGGHKTGFYLDQRHARRRVAQLAAGRRVLNVCSYTGAFSVIAAGSGAASVTSIDSSGPALTQHLRNAGLNRFDVGEQIEGDAFAELRRLRDRALSYDLIVLDPPKLANTEAQLDKASRAYKDLNLLACKLLAPGGVLMTFSCSGAMQMELFQKVVAGAALDAGRSAQIVARLHQPEDHPVPLSFPEAEYLKGIVLQLP
jgi:23S rRNA (cytosine1962-C5)-methyltransferase